MGITETIADAVVEPLWGILSDLFAMVPSVIMMAVVILVGYLLGYVFGNAVKHALHRMKFDDKFQKLHLAKPLEKIKISVLLGGVVKWYTFVVFAAAGANYINLYPVTDLINRFAVWFPNLLVAGAIGIAGALLAEYVYKMVMHVNTSEVKVLASVAKYFILVVVVIMALDQIVDVSVLENVMLILVGGISVGIALAVGIAFGLALKDEASAWVKNYKK